jgi:hyaluronoglucosaminidase
MPTYAPVALPPLGVIEGFFGRSWSWQERAEYAPFLAANGYQFYIYAPKNDHYLRRQWQQPWPAEEFQALQQLRTAYAQQGLDFGLGLSPFELYRQPDQAQRAALIARIAQINALHIDILCLLFDDMRGDLPGLAEIQAELVHLAAEYSNARRIIFCPTYYSYDPVLEKVFGTRPDHYWADLGARLDPTIDVFWTGEKVCSPGYAPTHLEEVAAMLRRKPFLWDNYPVNDGAIKAKHLHLRPYDTGHTQLGEYVAGHCVNPMNQPWLSRIPLNTLPRAYRDSPYTPDHVFVEACQQICATPLADYLIEDIELLQDAGLGAITEVQKHYLLERYQPLCAHPCAVEICDWLQGAYAFDPACLTD